VTHRHITETPLQIASQELPRFLEIDSMLISQSPKNSA